MSVLELCLQLIGPLITIFSGGFVLREILLDEKKPLDPWSGENRKRRFAKIAFVFLFAGGLFSIFSGIISYDKTNAAEKESKKYQEALLLSQQQLISLASHQIDTAHQILALSEKLNSAQQSLNTTQKSIINLQNDVFNQLSGGANKPLVFVGSGYNVNDRNDTLFRPSTSLCNFGKTYLKTIDIKIEDLYKGLAKVDSEYAYKFDPSYFIDTATYLAHINLLKSTKLTYTDLITTYISVNTLAPSEQKNIYDVAQPKNAKLIDYKISVNWSNGNYKIRIFGKYFHGVLYILNYDITVNGVAQDNHYDFFNIKKPTLIKPLRKCPNIVYRKQVYEVYRNPQTLEFACMQQNHIIAMNFANLKAASDQEASNLSLDKLLEIFGQ